MYATLIEIDVGAVDRDEGLRGLRERIVPAISGMPGFQSGVWLTGNDADIGLSLTLWETEAGAQAMAERFGVGSSPQANAAVTRCEVREVATTAGARGVTQRRKEKGMTTVTAQSTQVYQVFIKATPEAIWEAITKPEFTERYFYGARIENTPERHRSLGPDGSVWGDEPMYEFDPPRRLVQGWRSLYDPELADEDESRVTWEIEPQEGGHCLLTVTHDRLEGAPKTAESVAGAGWMMVLSGLKTLLETGKPLAG